MKVDSLFFESIILFFTIESENQLIESEYEFKALQLLQSKFFEKEFFSPVVILFGSLAKAEAKADSDMDIAVFTSTNKIVNLKEFEKKLKRSIQLFVFSSRDAVKNPELLNNLLNGCVIKGSW